jgi:hypothetical protein
VTHRQLHTVEIPPCRRAHVGKVLEFVFTVF